MQSVPVPAPVSVPVLVSTPVPAPVMTPALVPAPVTDMNDRQNMAGST